MLSKETGLRLLDPKPGECILEIGCGTGQGLSDLARAIGENGAVVGVDASPVVLAAAEERLERAGLADRVRLIHADATELPFVAMSFDAVYMTFSLERFAPEDIPVVLRECRRVLKCGGRLVVVSLSKSGRRSAVVQAYEWVHRHFPRWVDGRPIYVRETLEAAGYSLTAMKREPGWVPTDVVAATAGGIPRIGEFRPPKNTVLQDTVLQDTVPQKRRQG